MRDRTTSTSHIRSSGRDRWTSSLSRGSCPTSSSVGRTRSPLDFAPGWLRSPACWCSTSEGPACLTGSPARSRVVTTHLFDDEGAGHGVGLQPPEGTRRRHPQEACLPQCVQDRCRQASFPLCLVTFRPDDRSDLTHGGNKRAVGFAPEPRRSDSFTGRCGHGSAPLWTGTSHHRWTAPRSQQSGLQSKESGLHRRVSLAGRGGTKFG
jgi:hypothetical protein